MSLSTYYLEYGRRLARLNRRRRRRVVRTRPRAIPLAMITMRTHGFRLVSYMSMGLHLAALREFRY